MKNNKTKFEFRKGTPLAPVILRRDEIKEQICKKEYDNSNWISKLTKRLGKVAHEVGKEIDYVKLENELIELAAICLIWIEELREVEKGIDLKK